MSSFAPSGLREKLTNPYRGLRVAYGDSCAPGYKTFAPSGRAPSGLLGRKLGPRLVLLN